MHVFRNLLSNSRILAPAHRPRLALALGLLLIALVLGAVFVQTRIAAAAAQNRAGVVVVNGDGKVTKRCVEFNESEISGLDLLERTGLALSVDASNAMGVAVCKIGKEGCAYPKQNCFCQCQGASCVYWSYWRANGSEWVYSDLGASNVLIHNGDLDGWVWGATTPSNASPPPALTFDQVCTASSAPETQPTTTARPPTATDVPPTATPLSPSLTSVPPTETLAPTETPLVPTTTPELPTPEIVATDAAEPTIEAAPPEAPTEIAAAATEPTTQVQEEPTAVLSEPTTAPESQSSQPTPTSVVPPHTPTRVTVARARSAQPPNETGQAANADAPTTFNPHVLSGIVLAGGFVVGGCGTVVLLGAVAFYFLRRRA